MHYRSQIELKDQIATIDKLLELSSYNQNRTEVMADRKANNSNYDGYTQRQRISSPQTTLGCSQSTQVTMVTAKEHKSSVSHDGIVKVFCDGIGVGFGPILINYTRNLVINNCMSNISYVNLIDNILKEKHEKGTDLVIMMGDSASVTKFQLIQSIEKLVELRLLGNIDKIVISAFPFSDQLNAKQNKRIHHLNNILYNLIAFNSYENELTFFDINKYIHNFILTPATLNLPKGQKHELAKMLSFILNFDIPNNYGQSGLRLLTEHLDTTMGGSCKESTSEQNEQCPCDNLGTSESLMSLNI